MDRDDNDDTQIVNISTKRKCSSNTRIADKGESSK